ncbi:hypothetical protein Q5P01_000820 [Channa striata]|uniref:Uncharacterized protein n=1 Tax=Channa striata TaxID=64152 RepID=A0AA88IHU8_CHASR|nr:hypothetical protein Q5P01_000820 [Channa striata]
MVIHKVKESDYVESEPATPVLNMARTLGAQLHAGGTSRRPWCSWKDGPAPQKPSVRGIRSARDAPHEFCKRHLGEIEYAAMKLLADGHEREAFPGHRAEWGHGESSPVVRRTRRRPGFHFRYLDCRELEEDRRYSPRRPLAAVAGRRSSRTWTRALRRSEAVDYLYRARQRPAHVAFLGRFFESDARNDLNSLALELQKPRERSSANAVRHVFKRQRHRRSDARRRRLEPPHRRRRRESAGRDPAAGGRSRGDAREPRKRVTVGMARMAKAHAERSRAQGQPRRFLRLSRSGDMFRARKTAVAGATRGFARAVLFMAPADRLQRDAVGLGIKRLLTGAWRTEIFFRRGARSSRDRCGRRPTERERRLESRRLSRHGRGAAGFTGIPPRSETSTGPCEMRLMFRTLKYAVRPLGAEEASDRPEYGFSAR